MNELEKNVFAFFVATRAGDLNIAGRWYPRSDMVLTLEDKIEVATRKHGRKVKACSTAVANALVDTLLEKGALATETDKLGATLHQFQPEHYRAAIAEMQANDPIIAEAKAGGDDFWTKRFESLTGADA